MLSDALNLWAGDRVTSLSPTWVTQNVSSCGIDLQQSPWNVFWEMCPLKFYSPVIYLHPHVSIYPWFPLPFQYLYLCDFISTSPHSPPGPLSSFHWSQPGIVKRIFTFVLKSGPQHFLAGGPWFLGLGVCLQNGENNQIPYLTGQLWVLKCLILSWTF